eukprot:gene9873-biopygen1922
MHVLKFCIAGDGDLRLRERAPASPSPANKGPTTTTTTTTPPVTTAAATAASNAATYKHNK